VPIDAVVLKRVAVQVRNLSAGGCLLELRTYLPVGSIGVLHGVRCFATTQKWARNCAKYFSW